jgi:hypothetical protein
MKDVAADWYTEEQIEEFRKSKDESDAETSSA